MPSGGASSPSVTDANFTGLINASLAFEVSTEQVEAAKEALDAAKVGFADVSPVHDDGPLIARSGHEIGHVILRHPLSQERAQTARVLAHAGQPAFDPETWQEIRKICE